MIDWIVNLYIEYAFISVTGFISYWVPMTICVVVYTIQIFDEYRQDVKHSTNTHFRAQLTIGGIVVRYLVSVIPCINIFAAVFDCMGPAFKYIGKVLDIPLVRHRPADGGPAQTRKTNQSTWNEAGER